MPSRRRERGGTAQCRSDCRLRRRAAPQVCRVAMFAGPSDSFAPTELTPAGREDGLILSITQMGDVH
jgi:hypothetical protein